MRCSPASEQVFDGLRQPKRAGFRRLRRIRRHASLPNAVDRIGLHHPPLECCPTAHSLALVNAESLRRLRSRYDGSPDMRVDFDVTTAVPDGRPATSRRLFEPTASGPWRGSIAGIDLNGPVTVLAYGTDELGAGPRLHVHPYDETFIVIEGNVRFSIGDAQIDASGGDVVLGPAGVPHKFVNLGPDRLQTIDIHHSPKWIQTDLE